MKRLLTLLLPMMAAMAVSAQVNQIVINDLEITGSELTVSVPMRNDTPLRAVSLYFSTRKDAPLSFETDAAGNPVLYINGTRSNGHTYTSTTSETTLSNGVTMVNFDFTISSSNAFNGTIGEIASFKLVENGNPWERDYVAFRYAGVGTDMNGESINLWTEGQQSGFTVTTVTVTGKRLRFPMD